MRDFSLLPPPRERSPNGSKIQFSNKKVKRPIGAQGAPPSRGGTQCSKDQENTGITESSEFYYQFCEIENNLVYLYNKLYDSEYINGIVNLSSHTLTNTEIFVLSKGLGFCPIPGAPDIGNIIQDLDAFKRRTRLHSFFSSSNQDLTERHTQSGVPFEHKSFKLKSSFNPVGPFQLESIFYSIKQDLHRQRYRHPKKKNLKKEEFKAIRSLNKDKDIIIKPTDKGSAIVILNKQSYIDEKQTTSRYSIL